MKKKILLIAILIFGSINMIYAKVKIPVCFPCDKLETVLILPKDSKLQNLADKKVNLAYINSEYGILWTSVWNTDGRYVLSDVSNKSYFEIDPEIAKILKDEHKFDVATAESPLSFWKKAGGKIILGLFIFLVIWGNIPSKETGVKPTII